MLRGEWAQPGTGSAVGRPATLAWLGLTPAPGTGTGLRVPNDLLLPCAARSLRSRGGGRPPAPRGSAVAGWGPAVQPVTRPRHPPGLAVQPSVRPARPLLVAPGLAAGGRGRGSWARRPPVGWCATPGSFRAPPGLGLRVWVRVFVQDTPGSQGPRRGRSACAAGCRMWSVCTAPGSGVFARVSACGMYVVSGGTWVSLGAVGGAHMCLVWLGVAHMPAHVYLCARPGLAVPEPPWRGLTVHTEAARLAVPAAAPLSRRSWPCPPQGGCASVLGGRRLPVLRGAVEAQGWRPAGNPPPPRGPT